MVYGESDAYDDSRVGVCVPDGTVCGGHDDGVEWVELCVQQGCGEDCQAWAGGGEGGEGSGEVEEVKEGRLVEEIPKDWDSSGGRDGGWENGRGVGVGIC